MMVWKVVAQWKISVCLSLAWIFKLKSSNLSLDFHSMLADSSLNEVDMKDWRLNPKVKLEILRLGTTLDKIDFYFSKSLRKLKFEGFLSFEKLTHTFSSWASRRRREIQITVALHCTLPTENNISQITSWNKRSNN